LTHTVDESKKKHIIHVQLETKKYQFKNTINMTYADKKSPYKKCVLIRDKRVHNFIASTTHNVHEFS